VTFAHIGLSDQVQNTENEAHAASMLLIAAIPEETRRQTGTLPWYGMDYSLDDVIVYMYYGHKREHSAQIAAFHDRVR